MIKVKNPQDFWAGVLYFAVGVAAAWVGRAYTFGTATKMGPGYLPTVLAWGLAGIGALLIVRALMEDGPKIESSLVRPQFFILLAILVFSFLIERVGLAPTVVVVALVAGLASRETRWKEVAILAIGLALMCSILFVYLLGQPLEIWKWGF